MKLSLDWLGDWITLDDPAETIAERLTGIGLAVDAIERCGEALAGVIVARVEEVERHPGADRLRICRVNDGSPRTVSVVCGAPNVESGGVYPFAPIGVTLPGGLRITEAIIRGERSQGMLCSAGELGLSGDASGLLELDRSLATGSALVRALALDDTVLELDVPYNRPDWLGVKGIAREIAALTGAELRAPDTAPEERGGGVTGAISIHIDDSDGCSLYGARIVRGVRIGPSPAWLARRLEAIGQRSISNVVDVTNYVLHTYAQPIHAFDLDALQGGTIRVRRAGSRETLVTLDGVSRTLSDDVLVIADEKRAVALAGIMGGAATEVSEGTTSLLLEAARFDPTRVREGSASLGLVSDASTRFARGVDPLGVLVALDHTARWIAEVAGGEVDVGRVSAGSDEAGALSLEVRHARIERLLGTRVEPDETLDVLARLGFEPRALRGRVKVRVPSWRHDVSREEDLIEEVARFHGYDRFEERQYNASAVAAVAEPLCVYTDRSVETFVGLGFHEIVTPALTDREEASRSANWAFGEGEAVELLNARSEDTNTLRTALWPAQLRVARHNLHHGAERLRLVEHDKVFLRRANAASPELERWELAGIVSEPDEARDWSGRITRFDLFSLKGLLEAWCERMRIQRPAAAAYAGAPLREGEAFRLESGAFHAIAGRIDARIARVFDVSSRLWLFAVDLGRLLELTPRVPYYKEHSWFPQVKRDLAFVVPSEVTHAEIAGLVREAGGGLIRSVRVFDLYTGEQVPAGRKSLAFALAFQADERSLENAEVDRQVEKIVVRLSEACGATLRAS